MSAVTKEGVEVKVGQVWEDLDARQQGRSRLVVAVDGDKAVMTPVNSHAPRTKVAIRRMHKHSTGWKLIKDVG